MPKLETFSLDEKYNINEYEGFVYIVIDTKNSKYYIGKKNFFSRRTKPGNVNKTKTESNWRYYKTSSKHVKAQIDLRPDDFEFHIMWLAKDKTALNYLEAKCIIQNGALETDTYYNDNVQIKLLTSLNDIKTRVVKIPPKEK
jgi:hypothetical protein